MRLEAARGPLETIPADLLIGFHREDLFAPRGRTGQIDWYLDGLLSRLVARGSFRGCPGETALLAGAPKFRARGILIVGLGKAPIEEAPGVRAALEAGARAARGLGARRILLDPLSAAPPDLPVDARARLVEYLVRALAAGRDEVAIALLALNRDAH